MDTPSIPLKQCSRKELCLHPEGSVLPATTDYFSPDNRKLDGLMPTCKVCRNAKQRSKNTNPSAERYRRIQDALSRGMKYCPQCENEYLPASDYWYVDAKRKDGLSSWCRHCCISRANQWGQDNPDKVKERSYRNYWKDPELSRMKSQEYRATHIEERRAYERRYAAEHAEEAKERVRQWRLNNPERKRQIDRAYHKRTYNVEKTRESVRAWRRANPNGARAQVARRRALKKNAPGNYTAADIALHYRSQKGLCWWCSVPLNGKYDIDHRVALSIGGTNYPENLCLTCVHCNRSKNDKLPHEFNGRLL